MIEIIPHIDNGRITNLNFTKEDLSFDIEVKVFTVVNQNNENNIGTILEKYRSLEKGGKEYFEEKKVIIENFIKSEVGNFENFIPDCAIAFLPQDKNRKEILELVKEKVLIDLENVEIDISKKFTKIDPSKSIKKDLLTEKDFKLDANKKEIFKNLLIIDDVIDEGKTVDIFLNKMLDKELINKETTIKMICIYNRPKSKTKKITLDFLNQIIKPPSH